jgi:rhodanese-related sulfurtransferase
MKWERAGPVSAEGIFVADETANYRGDVQPGEAWSTLSTSASGALVDVRTTAEWAYVGLPEVSTTGRPLITLEWQSFPSGAVNPDFVAALQAELEARNIGRDAPLFFICRSGGRSAAAAAAMTAAGYDNCFNVAGGFEGPPDQERHRGTIEGWKVAGLPWRQR